MAFPSPTPRYWVCSQCKWQSKYKILSDNITPPIDAVLNETDTPTGAYIAEINSYLCPKCGHTLQIQEVKSSALMSQIKSWLK